MTTIERRRAVIDILSVRKFETRMNLAFELDASPRTIERDIEALSLEYPIYTIQGNGGGIRMMDGYRNGRKYLSESQAAFLKELIPTLSGDKQIMAKSILNDFEMPTKSNKKKR